MQNKNIEEILIKRRKKKWISFIIILIVLLVSIFFLLNKKEKLIKVSLGEAKLSDIESSINLSGIILPTKKQKLENINQEVLKIHIKLADRVKKGDLLLELDNKTLKENYEKADLAYNEALETMEKANKSAMNISAMPNFDLSSFANSFNETLEKSIEKGFNGLKEKIEIPDLNLILEEKKEKDKLFKELKEELEKLKKELKEYREKETNVETPSENGFISSKFEKVSSTPNIDLPSIINSNSAINSLENSINQAADLITQLKIARDSAKTILERSKKEIRADFDGIIVEMNAKENQITTGTLIEIYDDSSYEVHVDLNRNDANRIKLGANVEYRLDDLKFNGNVFFKSPIAKVKNSVLGQIDTSSSQPTVEMKMNLNGDDLEKIIIGFPIDAKITVSSIKDAICVPSSSLIKEKDNYFVFIVKNKTLSKRVVEIGIQSSDLIEIKKGMKAGEKVVLNPSMKLKNNQSVNHD